MKKLIQLLMITCAIMLAGCEQTEEDPYAVCTEYDELDSRILDLMDQVKTRHEGDRVFLQRFEMEQVYWIQYMNRRLRAIYPQDWKRYYRKEFGEDVFNPCKCKEMVRLAKNRIKDLEMYIKGAPRDQKDCPSMLNVKSSR